MITMIRAVAKSFTVAAALAACMQFAQAFTYISSTGTDANAGSGCTAAAPCATFQVATPLTPFDGQVSCLNAPSISEGDWSLTGGGDFTIDCYGSLTASPGAPAFSFGFTSTSVKIRHLTFNGLEGATAAISVTGGGNLVIEDCVFENFLSHTVLVIEPTAPLNLVIRNTRISNSGAGILINPQPGGSANVSLDHVSITQNSGGGIKVETTNGPVTVDIANSDIVYNSGNGINAVGGASAQNVVSIKNSVIAKNSTAGVQANGANAAVLVATTLLDQNTAGATSVVSGGHISTYGNNSIVGSAGSGFTGSAPLQ